MKNSEIIRGLNLWMEAWINDPDSFQEAYIAKENFLREKNNGEEPSYGHTGLEMMKQFLKDNPIINFEKK